MLKALILKPVYQCKRVLLNFITVLSIVPTTSFAWTFLHNLENTSTSQVIINGDRNNNDITWNLLYNHSLAVFFFVCGFVLTIQTWRWYTKHDLQIQKSKTEAVQNGRKSMDCAFLSVVCKDVAAALKYWCAPPCMESAVGEKGNERTWHMAGNLKLLERRLLSFVACGKKANMSNTADVCLRKSVHTGIKANYICASLHDSFIIKCSNLFQFIPNFHNMVYGPCFLVNRKSGNKHF